MTAVSTFSVASPGDWLALAWHFLSLSPLTVGGAITVAPDMHRYLVLERGWLAPDQFSASIALAQAAPGPNILFVALMGWHVGLNAGGAGWALLGALVSLVAIVGPSSVLVLLATRWAQRHQRERKVRAFKLGLAPLVIGLMLATAWLLLPAARAGVPIGQWGVWLLALGTVGVVLKTRVHLLWCLLAGAVLGGLGWV